MATAKRLLQRTGRVEAALAAGAAASKAGRPRAGQRGAAATATLMAARGAC
ncbi:hypothetical protein [Sorangium cellulosum]|uniref:hypothetical protein n=1 Tax=Sorangium TaxID=39643 RepID=UPI0012DB4DE4|nr:hypothetical protein [Sorangium cellulosum]